MPNAVPTTRKPDAVRVARHYPPLKRGEDRDVRLRQEFGPVLGVKRVFSRALPHHQESLITAGPHETLAHPYGHPAQGEERYDWFLAEKGADGAYTPVALAEDLPGEETRVKLGYLKPDPHAGPATEAAIGAAADQRATEQAADPDYQAQKAAKFVEVGILKPTEVRPEIQAHPMYQARMAELGIHLDSDALHDRNAPGMTGGANAPQ